MPSVEALADQIIAREGGYVNDPDDPGGPTKYGVTQQTLARVRGKQVTARDVAALTKAEARSIFIEHYFHRPRIDELPEPLHATVFDMYVNAGRHAVRLLQQLLTEMGQRITVDGLIGPQTIAAVRAAHAFAPDHLVDAYGIARRNYYYRLADRRPSLRKFARRRDGGKGGWISRAEEFVSKRYHLSEAEHRARVAAWA
ncbi:MAG: peptidoglycan-binding protein [Rhodobacteraceae bacterium]|nr:peptidoglycan-binding protein [Paracoccaceae bacterium]